MAVKVIRNTGKVEKYVLIDGHRHSIGPQMTQAFEGNIADKFLEECAPYVVTAEGISAIDDENYSGETKWLYNTTGDPDCPETLDIIKNTKRGREIETIRHPLYDPRVVSHVLSGGQKIITEKGAETSLNMASSIKEVWPYTRRGFAAHVADWLLRRDANAESSGSLRQSRPPSSFEPQDTWDYEELQIYVSVVDSKCNQGPTEQQIKKEVDKGKHKNKSIARVTEEYKTELWKRIFFRVADSQYKLPTKEEFESYKAAQASGAKSKTA